MTITLSDLFQMLTNSENQPHQFMDKSKELEAALSSALKDNIEETIKILFSDIEHHYISDVIHDLVKYCQEFKEAEDTTFWLSLREKMRVIDWNNIRDQIKYDIIENSHHYEYDDDKNEDDYTRGVLSAIRLIEHRVHCICDL